MKIHDGYRTMILDLELHHPDTGTYYDTCGVTWDDETNDSEQPDEIMYQMIWEQFSCGGYYHYMIVKASYRIDNTYYTTVHRYNGYELEKLPTIIEHIEQS